MIVGTAGHIDHGKTPLVKALTGVDTDRLPEEKKRGITIDLGFAPLTLDGFDTIGIVDVPGHEAFVRTMLAGASGIDLALLVIAADEGVMPQTREHLEILSLLDIQHAVVALTKSDLVDADWIALVSADVSELLSPTAYASAAIVAVSAASGAGIPELRKAIAMAASVVEERRSATDVFRMPVDRAFTMKGTGTVVTGTVWSGKVLRDDTVMLYPGGRELRVRGVQRYGASVNEAAAGGRAAIALAGCDVDDISRGSVLISKKEWVPTTSIEAVIEISGDTSRITPRTRLRFHLGTTEASARIIPESNNSSSGGIVCRVVLAEPVIARGGDRFVLRLPSPARTVGGGTVLDPYPPTRKRRSRTTPLSDLHNLLSRILERSDKKGIAIGTLPIRTGLPPSEIEVAVGAHEAERVGAHVYSRAILDELAAAILSVLESHAATYPLEPGVSLQTMRATLDTRADVIDHVLDRLKKAGRVELAGALAKLPGGSSELAPKDRAISDGLFEEISNGRMEPPSVDELTKQFGGKAPALLRKLEREGRLAKIADDRYYTTPVVLEMVGAFRSRLESGRVYSPAELKAVLGVSRKYLIPFLEFCDRSGVTERRAEGRVLKAKHV
ncbi:MAG TPA: selenocysteine-specific translation elongation factor [Gemmatimonadaceae bacterium]|nr:selenocysteine-specific translation elongation factor [Gemmatimonadaceae bacterium]